MSTVETEFCTIYKPEPELLAKYQYNARIYGDVTVRKDIASLKRTATSLRKNIHLFSMLPSKTRDEMLTAAAGLDKLVSALKEVALWSVEYQAFCSSQRKRSNLASIEQFAQNRWHSDTRLMEFEIALVNELCRAGGMREMGAWFHSHGVLMDVPVTEFTSFFDSTGKAIHDASSINIGRMLMNGEDAIGHKLQGIKTNSYRIGWADYNNYLGYRLSVKASADNYLRKLSRGTGPT